MRLFWTGGTRPFRRRVVPTLATVVAALALAVPAARAGTANRGLPGAGPDPIAHMVWGTPPNDDLGGAYMRASGSEKAVLGRIAIEPRALWLGYWWPVGEVRAEAAETVADTENGDPDVLTQFATFELHPWETRLANGAWRGPVHGSWDVSSDEAWYRNMAAGIGNARALVIVQVDLPFARKTTSTAPEQIDTYGARVLSANRYTTVYIDAGTVGWSTPSTAASLLIGNGIRYARGFALDDTDYDPTATEDEFGAEVVAALAERGVTGKHFIVNTDENGQPYRPRQVPGKGINDAPMCHGATQTACQRTGIPPNTDVASSWWHLGPVASRDAARYCDGYVWSGRPWDVDGGPFNLQSALWLGGNGEY
jgi:endoglucanase